MRFAYPYNYGKVCVCVRNVFNKSNRLYFCVIVGYGLQAYITSFIQATPLEKKVLIIAIEATCPLIL